MSIATATTRTAADEPPAFSPSAPRPASFSPPSHDDTNLRQIFDSPEISRQFSQRARVGQARGTGLLQNKYLTDPSGFQRFADATLRKCRRVVDKILAAQTVEDFKSLAKDMDRLSDLLCRVIDLCDFIRISHPDRAFQAAASQAYAAMFEYMNQLNTTTGLNDQLKRAMDIPEVVAGWTDEEKTVARILMQDFAKSAIDLPEAARHDFVQISNEIVEIGSDFVDQKGPDTPYLVFKSDQLKGMDPVTIRQMSKFGQAHLPTSGDAPYYALRQVDDPDVRREVYTAQRTASKDSIHKLEDLLKARSKLAKLCGYETFAHMALSDKMAKSPEAVDRFLTALSTDIRPKLNAELAELQELKNSDARRGNFENSINAWDRLYYCARLQAGLSTRARSPDTLSAFFSVGTVFQGLSRLFDRLYGIRFVLKETSPDETWHDDVRRLDVLDDSNNHMGVIYCDLFARGGRSLNPAHCTLRCSREVTQGEIEEIDMSQVSAPFEDSVDAATDGMAHAKDPSTGAIYQLPTVALICDFNLPRSSTRPTLLSFRDVQTLFHEMGHALHSILGRTKLQNVAGTRCATDFAELPSVLMEYFAFAPQVLSLWARHWQTDQPLPYGLIKERVAVDKRMHGAETEAQMLLAMLDQAYHSRQWSGAGLSSTAIYHDVFNRHAAVPEPAGTAWQGFFGHLYGYGASYYSYLFDRAIATRVWDQVFKNGELAVDRAAGEHYKDEVLRWGGSRDGWACVAGALKEPWIAQGGEKAMEQVGRWGVGEWAGGYLAS